MFVLCMCVCVYVIMRVCVCVSVCEGTLRVACRVQELMYEQRVSMDPAEGLGQM